jgi:beta-xylosidase
VYIGRETFLIPVEWKDDWPVFNGGNKIALQGESPHLHEIQTPVSWRDDFSSPQLQLGWYRKSMLTDINLLNAPS